MKNGHEAYLSMGVFASLYLQLHRSCDEMGSLFSNGPHGTCSLPVLVHHVGVEGMLRIMFSFTCSAAIFKTCSTSVCDQMVTRLTYNTYTTRNLVV